MWHSRLALSLQQVHSLAWELPHATGAAGPPPPKKKLATAGGGSGGKGTEQNLIMAGGTLVCFVWVFIHSSGSMAQIQEETVLFTVYLRETVPYIMWVCILDSMA